MIEFAYRQLKSARRALPSTEKKNNVVQLGNNYKNWKFFFEESDDIFE